MKEQRHFLKIHGYDVKVYQTEWIDYFDKKQINLCIWFLKNGEEQFNFHSGYCSKFLTLEEAEKTCKSLLKLKEDNDEQENI